MVATEKSGVAVFLLYGVAVEALLSSSSLQVSRGSLAGCVLSSEVPGKA